MTRAQVLLETSKNPYNNSARHDTIRLNFIKSDIFFSVLIIYITAADVPRYVLDIILQYFPNDKLVSFHDQLQSITFEVNSHDILKLISRIGS